MVNRNQFIGSILILGAVSFWTLSNFLGSTFLADGSYEKPFLLAYLYVSMFSIILIPRALANIWRRYRTHTLGSLSLAHPSTWFPGVTSRTATTGHDYTYKPVGASDLEDDNLDHDCEAPDLASSAYLTPTSAPVRARKRSGSLSSTSHLIAVASKLTSNLSSLSSNFSSIAQPNPSPSPSSPGPGDSSLATSAILSAGTVYVDFHTTSRLAVMFAILGFLTNYLIFASLQHTSVASMTVLISTQSAWVLLIGVCARTETFSMMKLASTVGSLVGVVMISGLDWSSASSSSDPTNPPSSTVLARTATTMLTTITRKDDGSKVSKPAAEVLLGNFQALLSAIIYAVYSTIWKRASNYHSTPSPRNPVPKQLDVLLLLGLAGLICLVFLLPFLLIAHFSGVETLEVPPSREILVGVLMACVAGVPGDVCWAYATCMISALAVTLGLCLQIPFSLLGEIIFQGRREGVVYWIGATIVLLSFVVVNGEDGGEAGGVEGATGSGVGVGIGAAERGSLNVSLILPGNEGELEDVEGAVREEVELEDR